MTYPLQPILIGAAVTYLMSTILASCVARLGFPISDSARRIGCIDGLRGFLALSVVIHHFVIWMQVTRLGGTWSPPTIKFFDQLGAGSVALFFMVTGLVFYPRILTGWTNTSWCAVYITRVSRLLPMILISVACVTVILAVRAGSLPHWADCKSLLRWVATWSEPPLLGDTDAGRTNAYVLWSLWYEWLFYFTVLPLAAFAMDLIRGRMPSWVIPVALLIFGLLFMLLHKRASILPYLPLFAVGMIAQEIRATRIVKTLQAPWNVFFATLAISLAYVRFSPYGLPGCTLFSYFFVSVACGNRLGGVLSNRGAQVLGECSFGIYVLHGCLLSILFVDCAPPLSAIALPALLPLVGVAVLLLIAGTYLFIERPCIEVGRSLAQSFTSRRLRADDPILETAP